MAQLSWSELNLAISRELRESDVGDGVVLVGEVDIPYYTSSDIEGFLLEISQQLLREVPFEDLEDIGSAAVDTTTYSPSGSALVAGTIKVVSVAIKPQLADTAYVAAQPLSPAAFKQIQLADVTEIVGWSVFDGKMNFIGDSARVVALVEPALATWQSTAGILPDGYDDVRIDWVTKQLRITNWVPKETV